MEPWENVSGNAIPMKPGFRSTILTFSALAILAFVTLDGKVRTATLIFLAGFGVKTWIVELKRRAERD